MPHSKNSPYAHLPVRQITFTEELWWKLSTFALSNNITEYEGIRMTAEISLIALHTNKFTLTDIHRALHTLATELTQPRLLKPTPKRVVLRLTADIEKWLSSYTTNAALRAQTSEPPHIIRDLVCMFCDSEYADQTIEELVPILRMAQPSTWTDIFPQHMYLGMTPATLRRFALQRRGTSCLQRS